MHIHLVSVKAWGSWNKRKQIPSEFLLSKQRGTQWPNAFPGHYPVPALKSHQAFISARCKCSSGKKCLPLDFPSTYFPFFILFFFSSLSLSLSLFYTHSLCLIITFHDWLQYATCCPADGISFLNRCICWSWRDWHWRVKVPFLAKEFVGVWEPLQHTEKAKPCPGNRPPIVWISIAGVTFVPWEKRNIPFQHQQ